MAESSSPPRKKKTRGWKNFNWSGMEGYKYMEKGANFLFLTPKKEEFLLLSLPSLTCVMNYERGDKNAFSSLIVSLEQQKNDRRKCTRCNLVLISAKKLYCVKCATAQRELEREKQRKEKGRRGRKTSTTNG